MKIIYAIIAIIAVIGISSATIPVSVGTKISNTFNQPNGELAIIGSNGGIVIDANFPAGADVKNPGVAKALASLIVDVSSLAYETSKEVNVSSEVLYDGNTPLEVKIYVDGTKVVSYTKEDIFSSGTYNEKVEEIQAIIDASA